MKLPGIRRQEVQSLGRRDDRLPVEGAARVRNIREQNSNILQGSLQEAELRRKARQEDLRGASADFDTLRQEFSTAQAYYQGNYKIADARLRADNAKARMYGQAFDEIGRGLTQLGRFSQQNQELKSRRQIQEASTAMRQAEAAFAEQYEGKPFLSGGDLTGSVDTPVNQARSQIPSAEVLPAMLEESMTEQIEASAQLIENEHFRSLWIEDAKQHLTGRVARADALANQYYHEQLVVLQGQELEQMVESGQFDTATAFVDQMAISDASKKETKDKIAGEKEGVGYINQISEGRTQDIAESLNFLTQPYDEYRKQGGKLDQRERAEYIRSLQSSYAGLTRKEEATNYAAKEKALYDLNAISGLLKDGRDIPSPQQLDDLEERLMTHVFDAEDGSGTKHAVEFQVLKMASEQIGILNKMGPEERERLIGEWYNAATDSEQDLAFIKVGNYMESAHEKMISRANSDMVQTAMDAGHNVNPIQFTPENFLPSLEQRAEDHAAMAQIYNADQGPLTKMESRQMATLLNSMSNQEKLQLYGDVFSTLGEEGSTKLWDQVTSNAAPTAITFAGDMVAADGGNTYGAELVLRGSNYRSLNKQDFAMLNSGNMMHYEISDKVGGMFLGSPERHAATKDAVYSAYVGLLLDQGVSDFTSLDSDVLDQAFKTVVGETMDQAGRSIPSFQKNMSHKEAETWLRTVDSEQLFNDLGNVSDGEGGVASGEEIVEGILRGYVTMEWVGPNSYLLFRNGTTLLSAEDNEPFIFEYDSNAPTTTEKRAYGITDYISGDSM